MTDTQKLLAKVSRLAVEYKLRTSRPILIRTAEPQQGNTPCFDTDQRYGCQNFRCPWRAICL